MEYKNHNDYWKTNGDYDPNDEAAGCMGVLMSFVIFVLALIICGLLGSCKTTQYVPVPEYHHDTLIQIKVVHDSIHVKDSTHVEWKDSIIKIEHWHTEYVDHTVHDTLYQSKTDTIPKPYPVEKRVEVEKQLSWWQKTTMYAGDVMLLLLLGLIIYGIIKLRSTLKW